MAKEITPEMIYEMLVGIDTRLQRVEKKLDEHDGYFAALSLQVATINSRLDEQAMEPA